MRLFWRKDVKAAKPEEDPLPAFHTVMPPDMFEWLGMNTPRLEYADDILDVILVQKPFAFRANRQGKWLAWYFAEILFRHCDTTGLLWFTFELLTLVAEERELTKEYQAIRSALIGNKSDVLFAELVQSYRDSAAHDRAAVEGLVETCAHSQIVAEVRPSTKQELTGAIIDAAKQAYLVNVQVTSGRCDEDERRAELARICESLGQICTRIAENSAGKDDVLHGRMRACLRHSIAPLIERLIEFPLCQGLYAIADMLAADALEEMKSRMVHRCYYDDHDLDHWRTALIEEAQNYPSKMGLPHLAALTASAAGRLFDGWAANK